jgi:hypothetical protein
MTELSSLHVKITGDNSQLKAAVNESIGLTDQFGRSLATTTKASDSADAAAKRRIATLKKNAQAGIAATRANRDLTTGYNAQKLSANQLSAANRAMAGSFRLTGASMAMMTKEVRNSRFHTANLGAQFNDIFVMMAAGQNPLVLAMQQGTQVSQVFTAMGGGPRDNVLALWDALKKVVSPMSLLTIGVIAGGAALFQWATKADEAEDAADALTERIKAARDASESLNYQLSALRIGVDDTELAFLQELTKAQEDLTAEIEKRARSQGQSNRNDASAIEAARERVTAAREELRAYQEQVAEKERLLNYAKQVSDQEREIWEAANKVSMESAENVELVRLMDQGLKAATIQAMQLAGVDIASGVEAAQIAAAQLSQDLNISFQAARDMMALQRTMRYSGRGGSAQYDDRAGVFNPTPETEKAAEALLNPKRGRSRATNNPVPNQLAGLQGELRSPAEQLEFEFAEKQEIMAAALQQELVTKQEHDRMMEGLQQAHSDKMNQIARTEWEAKLAGYAGAFGDLATLANSENQRLAAIGRAAGLIQLGIEGVQAASSAWQKGMAIGGPPVAGAFAAASVLKTAALMGQMRAQNPNPAAAITGGGSGGTAAGAGSSGGGGGGGAAPITSFSFTIQNDPMGYGEAFARQIIDQVNAAQRDGGRVQGFINRA